MSKKNKAEPTHSSFSAMDFVDPHTLSLPVPEIKTEIKQELEAEVFEEEECKDFINKDIKDEQVPLAPENEKHTLADQITRTGIKEESSQLWDSYKIEYTIKEEERDAEDPLAPDPTTEVEEPMEEDSSDTANPTENTLVLLCKGCYKTCTSAHCLVMHQKTCRGLKKQAEKVKPENISTDVQSLARRIDGVKMFCCQFCEYKSNQSGHVKQHLATHTGERGFKCEVCGKTFAQASTLNTHTRIHTGHRPHKCTQCDRAFTRAAHLKAHMSTHTGEGKFACRLCEYKAAEKRNLTVHMRFHTEERPYTCTQCDYRATRSSTLKKHTQAKHSSDKPFSCAHCEFRTAVKGVLNQHMKSKHMT